MGARLNDNLFVSMIIIQCEWYVIWMSTEARVMMTHKRTLKYFQNDFMSLTVSFGILSTFFQTKGY